MYECPPTVSLHSAEKHKEQKRTNTGIANYKKEKHVVV